MSHLERFIPKTHDEGHFVTGDHFQSSEFFQAAHPYLEGLVRPVFEEVVPKLDTMQGKWHPLGFMVYHLGVDEHGQSLRLHIWPQAGRIESTKGPHIHNHAWDLASHVLAGTYIDAIFQVSDAPVRPEMNDVSLRPFKLRYKTGGLDTFETDGSGVVTALVETRRREVGTNHEIEHGVFHVPMISRSSLTATLVLDSPTYGYDTTVLLSGKQEPFRAQRRPITQTEARLASDQLLSTLD